MNHRTKMEEQFLAVYDEYADAIFRHCYFRLRNNRELARDIMHEAFTRSWEYIAGGKNVENIRAFVYTVANNLIIDHVKKKKEASLDDMLDQGFSPQNNDYERIGDSIDARESVKKLDVLDPHYRDVVYMRYFDGLKPREIASITGESVNVISVRINRGLKMCKKLLKG